MIVHRDYRAQGDSTIKVFKDRIEFFNPGTLPQGVSIKDILSGKTASNPRNKQIASIFKEAGIIEKYGSGIKRVRQVLANAGAPEPVFEIIGDYFKVTLLPITMEPSSGVNGGVNNILDFITKNPGKNSREIKTRLDLPQRSIERWLRQLKDNNQIEFRSNQTFFNRYPADYQPDFEMVKLRHA